LKLRARLSLAERPQLKRSIELTMMNGMMELLSNRKWRELLGRYIFGTKE
jgi:hypothetical protein